MKNKRTDSTGEYLSDFTKREEALLKQVSDNNITLPFRLIHWRAWIGDSQIYLNELKNFIDKELPQQKGN